MLWETISLLLKVDLIFKKFYSLTTSSSKIGVRNTNLKVKSRMMRSLMLYKIRT